MWWFIPVILATQDSQMASLDKSTRFSLKNKLKQKGLCVWLKWGNTCLANKALSSKPSATNIYTY
jgi:hypothetical protein